MAIRVDRDVARCEPTIVIALPRILDAAFRLIDHGRSSVDEFVRIPVYSNYRTYAMGSTVYPSFSANRDVSPPSVGPAGAGRRILLLGSSRPGGTA